MQGTAEVLRLSRLNTNLKSVERSLGKKRLVSAQRQRDLGSLEAALPVAQNIGTR